MLMANQIPETLIEEIRKTNDIVDVVSDYVSLKKQGRNYLGLCPFHGEKTPSFSVTQEKQIFHCFGCGKGGNVFTFLMELEGFTFFQAVEHLANKSGVELPEATVGAYNQKHSSHDQVSLNAYEWLTKFYHHVLEHTKEGQEAKKYLIDRGVNEETIKKFQLGYAPSNSDLTIDFLHKKSFDSDELVESGLLGATDKQKPYDRFRGRVLFPIRNHLGKTVGFGGRAIHEGNEPKYLNSTDSRLFQKSKLLFNFDLARSEMKKVNQAVLFEGYMDVITADQHGILNGVASLGTSLTEHQAALIKRYVEEVVVSYDGDQAGIEAAIKAADLFHKVGLDVRVATIPENLDPDSYIQKYGGDRFKQEIINQSATYVSFYMQVLKRSYNLSVEAELMNYINAVIEKIATLDRAVDRDHYANELATNYQLSVDTIREEIQTLRQKMTPESQRKPNQPQRQRRKQQPLFPAYHNAERKLIGYMLYDEAIAERIKHRLGASFNIELHKVIVTHLYAFYEAGNEANISQFIERMEDEQVKQLVIELAMAPISPDISRQEIEDYIYLIESEQGDKAVIKRLLTEQKTAEANQDFVKAAQIGMEIVQIKKQMQSSQRT